MERQKPSVNYKSHSRAQSTLKTEINKLVKGLRDFQKQQFPFWEEVVGARIAKVAVPVKNKKGVLFVKVEDAIWRFELTRSKDEIIKKINHHLNKNIIKDIVFI
jgi:predicted nucleic acid-binding Zn ribbon protein